MLPGSHDVELPAHLGESVVDVRTEADEVLPEVDEVLPNGVETCGGGPAELTDFAAELADVALGGPGLHRSSLPVITDEGITSFRPGQRGSTLGLPVEPTDVGSTMELLRHVVVLLHIVGFAITFGAWTAEAAAKRSGSPAQWITGCCSRC